MQQETTENLHRGWVACGHEFYNAMTAARGRAQLGPDADTPEQHAFAAWTVVDAELWRRGYWRDEAP